MTVLDQATGAPALLDDDGTRPPDYPPDSAGKLRRPSRRRVAVALALAGLLLVGLAEAFPPGTPQDVLADGGVLPLLAAAVLEVLPSSASRGPSIASRPEPSGPQSRAERRAWRWTLLGVGAGAALVAQTWFRAGTAIAGGDIAPPIGTAWIGRLFAPIAWSGTNLGGPGQAEGQLPWAALDWAVHAAGGSGALAQRLWLTLLLAAIPLAAAALARALRLSPAAGVATALLYAFSPYVLSNVGVNDVYLVAMVLLAALPAFLVGSATRSIPLWATIVGFVVAAPFVGFAYANPPLVGMLAGALLLTPLLAWLRFGRSAAARSLFALVVAGLALVGASAYWLIPDRVAVAAVATGELSPLSRWGFTESRATLANGLWLNNTWAWRFPAYYPYARDFARLPLVLVRPLLPLVSFGALAVWRGEDERTEHLRRTAAGIALFTILIMVLSTGTNTPGDLLFDPMYSLPYGWLLQEPGRFLMVASLGTALLVGVLVERLRPPATTTIIDTAGGGQARRAPRVSGSQGLALTAVAAVALASFPLWTGRVVPGPRPPFPSSHVRVPSYWESLASYLNSAAAPEGHLLVLPPDDFYQMPYTWYYGSDSFIEDLLDRPVVDPSGQGYDRVSNELLAAVDLEAEALSAGDWAEAARLLAATGTPLVLVRGDVEAGFPGRNIVSPALLVARLRRDPLVRLVHRSGPLFVFALRRTGRTSAGFATVDTPSPDLRALALLPSNTSLVSGPPAAGHLAVYQLPPVATWRLSGGTLTTSVTEHPGRRYRIAVLAIRPPPRRLTAADLHAGVARGRNGQAELRIRVPVGPSLLRDGTFAGGVWGPVGNCNDAAPVVPPNVLNATVVPRGGPAGGSAALRLDATVDAACEAQRLDWHGGDLLLRLQARSVSGAPAALCVWEQPVDRCAPASPLPAGPGWQSYSTVIHPDSGTTELSLFLYAYVDSPGQHSVEEYAGVTMRSLPFAPAVAVLAPPITPGPGERLLATNTGFSTAWSGPAGEHVVVDGLRNGWLQPQGLSNAGSPASVTYGLAEHEPRDEIGLAVGALLLAAVVLELGRKRGWVGAR